MHTSTSSEIRSTLAGSNGSLRRGTATWKARRASFIRRNVTRPSRYSVTSDPRVLLHLHPRGNLDLPHLFPFFGSAQLEVLSVFTALLLFFSQVWVCFHVKGRVLLGSSYVSCLWYASHSSSLQVRFQRTCTRVERAARDPRQAAWCHSTDRAFSPTRFQLHGDLYWQCWIQFLCVVSFAPHF